jgi:hypothetical protein
MHYDGPNVELVNEVIDFFLGSRLLSAVGGSEDRPCVRILTDISQAAAIGTDNVFAVDSGEDSEEDLEYTWGDLLDNLAAELIYTSDWYEWQRQHQIAWEKLAWPFGHTTLEHFRWRVPGEFVGHVGEEVWDVLRRCTENRAFNGKTENFWEQLLGLYFEGLWPCGWEGRWPEPGRFIAWRRAAGGQG